MIQAWREDIKLIATSGPEKNKDNITFSISLYYTCFNEIPDWAFSRLADWITDALLSSPEVFIVESQ